MKKLSTLFLTGALLSSPFLTAQPSPTLQPSVTQQQINLSTPSNQIKWLNSFDDAVALSQSTSKPIAILFTGTSWCPACIKLEREVLTNPEFIQAIASKFVFLKAEFPNYSVTGSRYKPLVDRYGVTSFPTIIVVNSNGQQLYKVDYSEGGAPSLYAQKMLQKLNQR